MLALSTCLPAPPQLLLALMTIGPWAVIIFYDILLYLYRAISFEIPVVGGRARGKARPRAPSLTERPHGGRRSIGVIPAQTVEAVVKAVDGDGDASVRRREGYANDSAAKEE